MRLDWRHAFGGPGFAANPAGIGYAPEMVNGLLVQRLPNVERPGDGVDRPDRRPAPACPGAMDVDLPERLKLLGTDYGDQWRETLYPGFARDMDWQFFNAAAPEQRWNDELSIPAAAPYEIWNMHPEHAVLRGKASGSARTRLRGEKVRAAPCAGRGAAAADHRLVLPAHGAGHADLSRRDAHRRGRCRGHHACHAGNGGGRQPAAPPLPLREGLRESLQPRERRDPCAARRGTAAGLGHRPLAGPDRRARIDPGKEHQGQGRAPARRADGARTGGRPQGAPFPGTPPAEAFRQDAHAGRTARVHRQDTRLPARTGTQAGGSRGRRSRRRPGTTHPNRARRASTAAGSPTRKAGTRSSRARRNSKPRRSSRAWPASPRPRAPRP